METQSTISRPFRSLGLDLVRATEGAALAAGYWMGLDRAEEADEKVTEKMISVLDTIEMDGHIVVGEETRRNHHGPLQTGLRVGTGDSPQVDVVADPIDGRALLAQGHLCDGPPVGHLSGTRGAAAPAGRPRPVDRP